MNLKEFKKRVTEARLEINNEPRGGFICNIICDCIMQKNTHHSIKCEPAIMLFANWYKKKAIKESGRKIDAEAWLYAARMTDEENKKLRLRYFNLFINRVIRNKLYKNWK